MVENDHVAILVVRNIIDFVFDEVKQKAKSVKVKTKKR